MKKIGILAVVLLCLSSIVMAETLEMWVTGYSNEEKRILSEIIEQTFTAQTGIEVRLETVAWGDYEQKYILAAVSGDGPDVAHMGAIVAPQLGVRGALEDLAKYEGYAELEASTFPGLVKGWRYKSVSYGVPFGTYLYPMFVRTDILADLGISIPDNWDEFRAAIPKIQANNMNASLAWGLSGNIYCDVSMFMWQKGADWYNADLTKSDWDSPEGIAGFVEYMELYTKYGIEREVGGSVRVTSFRNGYTPITFGNAYSDYGVYNLTAPEIQGKWQMVVAPGTMTQGEMRRDVYAGPMTLSIMVSSKKKALAWELIKFLAKPETQARYAERVMKEISGITFIPSDLDAFRQLPIPDRDREVLEEQARHAKTPSFSLAPREVSYRLLDFAAHEVVQLGKDPVDAIKDAAKQMTLELQKKNIEFKRFLDKL
ncbi:MAG TPA: extracellular solute-binding protein [Bacillota bacterium]|nr:extracellular solute-binding protein [Bacillota bacterium]